MQRAKAEAEILKASEGLGFTPTPELLAEAEAEAEAKLYKVYDGEGVLIASEHTRKLALKRLEAYADQKPYFIDPNGQKVSFI